MRPSTRSSILSSSFSILPASSRICATVIGHAEIAMIMCFRPSSIRLAISISPSRVRSSTEPISRMYMRTGSVVRPNSESSVETAASAASSTSSAGAVGAASDMQQRLGVGGLVVDLDPHVADHADDALDLFGVEDVVGQVVVDLGEREEAAVLAEHDQRLQAALARLDVGRRQHARRDLGVPAVLALAACVLGALAGDPGGDLARRRLVARRRRCGRRRPSRPSRATIGARSSRRLWARAWLACAGFATGSGFAFGSGFASFGLGRRLPRGGFFFAAGLAARAFGCAAASSPSVAAPGGVDLLRAAFLRRMPGRLGGGRLAGRLAGLAGDLRAGFLAMVILSNRVPHSPISGRTGKPQILSCR